MTRHFLAGLAFLAATITSLPGSPIKPDETVVFFPSHGAKVNAREWELDIRGWIFEQERRPGIATAFSKVLGISREDLEPAEKTFFDSRTAFFLVDAERGKRISIRLAEKVYELSESDSNGHFSIRIRVPETALSAVSNLVQFQAVTEKGDPRTFAGQIQLIEPEGISVISDIDDTIKVSDVLDRKKLLRNTFLKEFTPAPGMAALYRGWHQTNRPVAFHYLSASPSQLYFPIVDFLSSNEFPAGSFHLRSLDWRTEFQNHFVPKKHKPAVLEQLMQQFPKRQFILVGDSGESDPEIYGDIARKHPEKVLQILIRNVTGEPASAARYKEAFKDLPTAKWFLFKEPAEITWIP